MGKLGKPDYNRDWSQATHEEQIMECHRRGVCIRCMWRHVNYAKFTETYEDGSKCTWTVAICKECMTPYENSLYCAPVFQKWWVTEEDVLRALRAAPDLFQEKPDGKFVWMEAN